MKKALDYRRIIAGLRHGTGQTQTQFGRTLGVGQRTVSEWERGRNLTPIRLWLTLNTVARRTYPFEDRDGVPWRLVGARPVSALADECMAWAGRQKSHRPKKRVKKKD